MQCLTYLFEVLSWKLIFSQLYVGWIRIAQQIFPAHRTMYFLQLMETNFLSETIVSQAQQAYLLVRMQQYKHWVKHFITLI